MRTGTGLEYAIIRQGKSKGRRATRGRLVTVNYKGWLNNGKVFDSSYNKRPFTFRLGTGQVIAGWDQGVKNMREGEKRRLKIPPSLGYGNKKTGPIPPNSTLNFDIELIVVR